MYRVCEIQYEFDGQLCVGDRCYDIRDNGDLGKQFMQERAKITNTTELAWLMMRWRPFLFDSFYGVNNLTAQDRSELIASIPNEQPPLHLLARCAGMFLPMIFLRTAMIAHDLIAPFNVVLVQLINAKALIEVDGFLRFRYELPIFSEMQLGET